MAGTKVPPRSAATELAAILDSREIAGLIEELDATRETGRPGYPVRAMVGMALAKSIYECSTWTRIVALVREHGGLREALGCATESDVPSNWACYRFAKKLRRFRPILDSCIARVLRSLKNVQPEMGQELAIDGTDIPAYANGQRYLYKGGPERKRYSDPDASWGHRSAVSNRGHSGYYGYKAHLAVYTQTELPLAWHIDTAKRADANFAVQLLEEARERGFSAETCAMDKAYDLEPMYHEFEARDCHPIIPLRETEDVKAGDDLPPRCSHGEWKFAGADYGRKATKWRCPKRKCRKKNEWVKADRLHPLIPRKTKRGRKLYKGRGAVERENGRLKGQYGLTPLRVRGLERVRLHADLTILARLSCALARARPAPLAARSLASILPPG